MPEKPPDPVFKMSDDGEEIYVDVCHITHYLYSFEVLLGRRSTVVVPEETEVNHETLARVIMSPQHAKDMAVALIEMVSKYEDKHGPIPSQYQIESLVVRRREEGANPSQGTGSLPGMN